MSTRKDPSNAGAQIIRPRPGQKGSSFKNGVGQHLNPNRCDPAIVVGLSAVRVQDVVDQAAFSVWERIQRGEPLAMSLCHQVIAELGSTANANRVYLLVRQWQVDTDRTRRLGWR